MGVVDFVSGYVVPFLVVFTAVVFVHEMGHYLAARWCGVRVEVFSVGVGPELLGWTDGHGTRWKLAAVPVGGYVKMLGEMQPGAPADPGGGPGPGGEAASFAAKTVGQRSFVVAAGPLANFALAVAVLAAMFATVGQSHLTASVGSVAPGSAAERAGFMPGDLITEIDGVRIERFQEVVGIVQLRPGARLAVRVSRGGREVGLVAVPDAVDLTDRFGNPSRIGRLGIVHDGTAARLVRHDPLTALWRAAAQTAFVVREIFVSVGQIVAGRRTAEELGGPIRIAKLSGDVWTTGAAGVLTFVALLSINLGLVNLLPIPMLDGGHLLFYAAEAVRGRPLGARAQEYGLRMGLGLVLALMVFVTWNDLIQLRVIDFLVDLAT